MACAASSMTIRPFASARISADACARPANCTGMMALVSGADASAFSSDAGAMPRASRSISVNPASAARIEKTIRRSRKSNSRREAAVARPEARGQACNVQPRRTAAHRNRMAGAYPFGQGRFKALDRRTLRQEIAAKHGNDSIDIGLIDALSSITENRR